MEDFTVKIKTTELLDKLIENLENHTKVYEEAKKEYKKQLIHEISEFYSVALLCFERIDIVDPRKIIKDLPTTTEINRLPVPVSHEDEYKRVIEMLSLHSEEFIEIPEYMFRQYAQDDWDWKKGWTASMSNYTTV